MNSPRSTQPTERCTPYFRLYTFSCVHSTGKPENGEIHQYSPYLGQFNSPSVKTKTKSFCLCFMVLAIGYWLMGSGKKIKMIDTSHGMCGGRPKR